MHVESTIQLEEFRSDGGEGFSRILQDVPREGILLSRARLANFFNYEKKSSGELSGTGLGPVGPPPVTNFRVDEKTV